MSSETCWFCGDPVPPVERTREHLVPTSKGGRGVRENVATAHEECNKMAGDWDFPLKRILRAFLREYGRSGGLATLKRKGRKGWKRRAENSLGRWNKSRRKKADR